MGDHTLYRRPDTYVILHLARHVGSSALLREGNGIAKMVCGDEACFNLCIVPLGRHPPEA